MINIKLKRPIRYQGAIIRDHHILLIRHMHYNTGHTYWIFPGGGIESEETEEECVKREMKEETNLSVRVLSLLDEMPKSRESSHYSFYRTYLCEILSGDAKPGYDPEYESESNMKELHSIVEIKWFNLRDESSWDPLLVNDPIIYLPLQRLRKKLGYLPWLFSGRIL